jgi:hypothetical protein
MRVEYRKSGYKEKGMSLRKRGRNHAIKWSASLLSFATSALVLTGLPARADLVLETETAELGKKGDSLVSSAIQLERGKDGGRMCENPPPLLNRESQSSR